jgi:hypothetical protein
MFDYYECHRSIFKYILIPALQGILYIKTWLCPTEDIVDPSNDSDEIEVLEGKLIGKDESFSHVIDDKNLEDIQKGMNVGKLAKILCYVEGIPFDSVERLTIDYIYKGGYTSNDYKIETESTDVI